ncbi:MAG: adenosylcobalamin-dependent ribonucleoside-diphosphate reductase [Chloroflexi bacterium]|nr:adenosylcobalamin-dependent ribonucleoside-diphosphate reductase [Chloroflexota bacterium]MQC26529.1 adenosylcobalamin-dependent ribonucleoside-diphosphate reductase [Chloroflexota bacterium]
MLQETNTQTGKSGMLPTPSRPADLPDVGLSENAYQVFARRYMRRGQDGQPIEAVEDTYWRVAYHVGKVEEKWGADPLVVGQQYYDLLGSLRFTPNSPTFTGAGTPIGQLAACFVLPISDDMGRAASGIFQTLRDAALIQQTGGGNGFAFSRLRPKKSLVKTSAGRATGPVGFLRVYDEAFGEIAQGGTRRGANMAVLRVDHPDVEDFITCKTDENSITNFNISVGITDAFMHAVRNDEDWDLRFVDVTDPTTKGFDGTLEQAEADGLPIKTHKTVNARELFNSIVEQAHHNGEPGLLFLDAANRSNPVPHLYPLEATNPCGEQWLGPYENCCLGSINLAKHLGPNGTVDWEQLRHTVELSTRFLDDVVEENAYVPAVPQLKEAAYSARRIGLGVMALADMLYHVGIRYGSDDAQDFAGQIMEFVRYHSMRTSIELARERQPFPAIEGSIYDPDAMTWQPPTPLRPYANDYGSPELNWDEIVSGIAEHGIRNAAQTTIAPTGTIATVSGCEGYGCEPVFALAYLRHVNDQGTDLTLIYTSPLFEAALEKSGLDESQREIIIEQVLTHGSCQDVEVLPQNIRDTFVTSSDITAEEHVRMQGALQAFVDNSLSKTVNFPEGATEEDVATAYQLAWELGCKGITVYVTGSRDKVVLETHATANAKDGAGESPASGDSQSVDVSQPIWNEGKRPRPSVLQGVTHKVETPLGRAFVTINENGESQPFEAFITTAKAGSETAAVSEAFGRLISYVLRLASPVAPRQRLLEIRRQLSGIGGDRQSGFGPNKVRSFPDGIAQALKDYLVLTADRQDAPNIAASPPKASQQDIEFAESKLQRGSHSEPLAIGSLCPECGHSSLIKEEGCAKCYTCGFSEC